MIFHCLVNPYVPCNKKYTADGFNQLAIRFCEMMTKYDHCTIFYGNGDYVPNCKEYVAILKEKDYDLLKSIIVSFNDGEYLCHREKNKEEKNTKKEIVKKYNEFVIEHIKNNCKREKKQIIIHFYDFATKMVGDAYPEFPSVQFALGNSYYAYENVIFCSSYFAGYFLKLQKKIPDKWTIIKPILDDLEFTYNEKKRNAFLYLGRIQTAKGIRIIFDLAKLKPDIIFWIAGQYNLINNRILYIDNGEFEYDLDKYPNVVFYGFANVELRKKLLSECLALIQPSQYEEPFGLNVVEAYLSGTPVITSNLGAFNDTVIHKVTGYICSDINQYLYAIEHIYEISNEKCYEEGKKYLKDNLYKDYINFFNSLHKISGFVGDENILGKNMLVDIAKHYEQNNKYEEAYFYAHQVNDNEDEEIKYKKNHLLGIISYYVHKYIEGYNACKLSIESKNLQIDNDNLKYYEKLIYDQI